VPTLGHFLVVAASCVKACAADAEAWYHQQVNLASDYVVMSACKSLDDQEEDAWCHLIDAMGDSES